MVCLPSGKFSMYQLMTLEPLKTGGVQSWTIGIRFGMTSGAGGSPGPDLRLSSSIRFKGEAPLAFWSSFASCSGV